MALVRYNAKNVYSCCGLRLLPGVNDVREQLLNEALTVPLFKWRVDTKIIEILQTEKPKQVDTSKPVKKGKKKKSEVDSSLYKQILKLIPEIYDLQLLKKYLTYDDGEVVAMAKKQLEKIENEPVEKTYDVTVE